MRGGTYRPEPARARRLLLSALGGWLDVHGRWPVPDIVRLPDDLSPYITPRTAIDPDRLRTLVDRSHVERLVELARPAVPVAEPDESVVLFERFDAGAVGPPLDRPISVFYPEPAPTRRGRLGPPYPAGRDQYVEFPLPGLLWPVGHLASLITITERKFEPCLSGRVGAYLRQLRVHQGHPTGPRHRAKRLQAFPHACRELPFTYGAFRDARHTGPQPSARKVRVRSRRRFSPRSACRRPPTTSRCWPATMRIPSARRRGSRGPLLFVPFVFGRPIAGSIAKAVPIWGAPGASHTATARAAPVALAPLTVGTGGAHDGDVPRDRWGVATTATERFRRGRQPCCRGCVTAMVSVPALSQVACRGPGAGRVSLPRPLPPAWLRRRERLAPLSQTGGGAAGPRRA